MTTSMYESLLFYAALFGTCAFVMALTGSLVCLARGEPADALACGILAVAAFGIGYRACIAYLKRGAK